MTPAASVPSSLSGERAGTLTAEAIADIVGGELRGAAGILVNSVAALDRAEPSQLGFFADGRYAGGFANTRAGVVLVTAALADSPNRVPSLIVVDKPAEALLLLLPVLYPPVEASPAIHSTARIGRGATLGRGVTLDAYAVIGKFATLADDVRVGAHCVVGDGVRVGAGSHLFPGATLYTGAELGERVLIHSGARIAADGFGYLFSGGAHVRIPHVGRCIIGDDVEIGANTTVDRGSIDDTVVGAGTKVDNLVQIAHNVRIGRNCLIMSQAGIAGSAHIGDGCVIAGQAGIAGHVTIGDGARIAAQAGVFGDVPPGETWSGYPARPHREALRASAALFRLSGMMKRIARQLDEQDTR